MFNCISIHSFIFVMAIHNNHQLCYKGYKDEVNEMLLQPFIISGNSTLPLVKPMWLISYLLIDQGEKTLSFSRLRHSIPSLINYHVWQCINFLRQELFLHRRKKWKCIYNQLQAHIRWSHHSSNSFNLTQGGNAPL